MNSFAEWLKVVLAVAMLALLVQEVFFYLVGKQRGFLNTRNHLEIIMALKANPVADQQTGCLPAGWLLGDGVKREL
ncbi:MAG: hypothetical protein ABSF60_09815 [Verrucomicrobiota bacterium]